MDAIRLTLPGPAHEAAVCAYLDAYSQSGESHLHGSAWLTDYDDYAEWLAYTERCADAATVPAGLVPATAFLGVREADGLIVGTIHIRHALNEYLRLYGGHIGYGVRHDMRRRGYATQMLDQALAYCRDALALPRVMLTCNVANTASARTIQRCGGVRTAERIGEDGQIPIHEYWIEL